DPLEQIVEGRASYLGQGVAGALERQPVGYVLVDKGESAKRMRRHRQQQGAVVRQMHQLLLPVDQRREELQPLAFEGTEIGMFGDAATLAQSFQNVAERRLGGEPIRLEAP